MIKTENQVYADVISFIIVGGSSFVIVSVVSYLLFPGVKDFVIRLKKNKSNE